jgi:hypothetical protein
MLPMDIEKESLRPTRTLRDPVDVVEGEDPGRDIYIRAPRNVDVRESVFYEQERDFAGKRWPNNALPPHIRENVQIYRQPKPNSDTGERSALERWGIPDVGNHGAVSHAAQLEDIFEMEKQTRKHVHGFDIDHVLLQGKRGEAQYTK